MTNYRTRVWILLATTATVMFAACQQPEGNDVAAPTREIRQVTDDLGRTVTVPVEITRVVSTAPSITEMVFAAGGGDRLVGVTTFCNYPEEAKSIAKIGDTMTPNMETIVATKPDVVFVSTASQLETFAKVLEQNGIAVYVMNPTSLDAVFESMQKLADILGTAEMADALVVTLADRESFIRHTLLLPRSGDPVQANSVFVQISKEPLFTIGDESYLNQVIESAGGRSITRNVATAYPKLSKETALALRPEVIILSDSPDNQEPNEAFRNSPAVKNGRVYKINADILSRPGPRLVDALEQIAKVLHPEKF
jgi:iron complex transport system substrate-binding protein